MSEATVSDASATIQHVSDTARWVALYRAMESERPDALFHDPYARRLAGERGERILASMKQGRTWAWPMIVRTAVMDELILRAIARDRVDTVLNLAAGLDTRPYRLPLAPALRWIEVDFPDVIAYKQQQLAGERAACGLEQIGVDLTDAARRRALFAQIGAAARRVLVVSEGLLIYLTGEQVGALARDLNAQPSFAWWLIDLASPGLLKMMCSAERSKTNPPARRTASSEISNRVTIGFPTRATHATIADASRQDLIATSRLKLRSAPCVSLRNRGMILTGPRSMK